MNRDTKLKIGISIKAYRKKELSRLNNPQKIQKMWKQKEKKKQKKK